jgi:hypothetical protein
MSGGFNLDDYVDVAERIRLFYEKFPDGRLVTVRHGRYVTEDEAGTVDTRGHPITHKKEFVFCEARAYRTPDDPQPCAGTAWEPIPGATPYTRDSELMNAETAAWGRAIIAAGIPSKKIASQQEVQARREPKTEKDGPLDASDQHDPAEEWKKRNRKMRYLISKLDEEQPLEDGDWTARAKEISQRRFGKVSSKDLTPVEHQALIDELDAYTVPFG